MRPRAGMTRLTCVLVALGACSLLAAAVAPRSAAPAGGKALNQLVRKVRPLDPTLGNSAVTSLLQTRDGYMWVGTEAGLARFDGVRYDVFNTVNTDAFATDHVSALWEDAEGTLWIGTFGGGVVRFRDGRFTPALTSSQGLLSDVVRAIYGDSTGALWIATRGDGGRPGGLNRLRDGEITHMTAADGLPGTDVWTFYEDRAGGLWIGTYGGGAARYADGVFRTLTTRDGLAGNDVRSICEDEAGTVWIGAHDGGLSRYRDGVLTSLTTADGLSSTLIVSLLARGGDLWIGTANGGLNRLRDGRVEFLGAKEGLPGDSVGALLFDREGNLWVGSSVGALCTLQDGQFTTYTTREGLSFNLVCPVLEARNGDLWVGTFGGGINRYRDGRFTSYTTRDGLPSDDVNSLMEDRDGRLWVGTYGAGLSVFDGSRFRTYTTKDGLSSNTVKALCQDRDGTVWIGTDGGGLCRFRDGEFRAFTTADGLAHDIVIAVVEDGQGGLWIGTDGGGLSHLGPDGFTSYTTRDGLSNNRVWSLYLEPDGTLWVGTDFGLTRLADGVFTAFTRRQGLSAVSVNQILDDGLGNLWISSTRGIFRVSKGELADCAAGRTTSVTPVVYGQADGLKSEQCTRWFQPAGCRTRDGRLWFPTVEGLATIDPAMAATAAPPPACLVESIQVDGAPLDAGQGLEIQASREHFEFRYTCLSLTAPERLMFRYRVEGFDADWIDAGARRSAFYTNIPPGEYEFQVMARNGEGAWSEVGRSSRFRILVPWWKSWQAYALLALAVAAAVGAGYTLRMRSLKRHNVFLEEAVANRTTELAEKNEALAALVEASPLGIVVWHLDGTIAQWNKAAERIYGWTSADAVAGVAARIVPEARQEEFRSIFDRLIAGETFVELETERVRKDGTRIPVAISATALRDSAGQVATVVSMHNDITERKRARHELLAAKETAEAATRAKSEFLANMSHEIRTPMNAVIGMTGLLLDTHLDKDQVEFASTIRTSGEALLSIINDILDFSKIEAGQIDFEEAPFDLQDCIEETLDVLAARAAEKGLDLAYLIESDVPRTVAGDVTRLRQVLVNLVGNAVKFTDAGDAFVSLAARRLEGDRYELTFAVRDTGIGIPADRMDRLFRSFSQVDASTTRHYGGTGLGLAISRRLAELMGGTMWVESEVGKGSSFFFTIEARALPSQPRVYQRGAHSSLDGKRLLIVDDNETNRRVLSLQTERWGMVPSVAATGPEALDRLAAGEAVDLAILDMSMPDLDGAALAGAIRRLPGRGDLPLVLLSSMGRPKGSDIEAGRFAAVLTKPVKASQLYDVLQQVLGGQQQIAVRAAPMASLDARLGERHPLRILLADDSVVNQKVALRILDRMGYRADVAMNGLEVLEALRRQTYDVVLMDVQMPEMDGLEATRTIAAEWPAAERPRIVAMTANVMQGDRERCLDAGMDDYISKPVRVGDLQRALQQSTRRVRPTAEDLPRDGADDGDAEIAELREFFLETAFEKLERMAEALVAIERRPEDAEALAELSRSFHNLAGTGGTFGYQRVTDLSRVGEGRCKALVKSSRAPETVDIEAWRELLGLVREDLDGAPSSRSE